MSKERLDETDFEEIWKPVKSVIEYYRMDYGEAVTIGGQFGVLEKEIKLLQQQNKRYREAIKEIEEAKYNYYGNEYPDAVDEIVRKALKGEDSR